MSEMLGNHYFLSRDFGLAIEAFSKTFHTSYPNNILKKLIICHITQGNIKTAKEYFLKVISDNPFIIINTDIVDEDCPCPNLINQIENKFKTHSSLDDLTSLGMLWLYCDIQRSLDYFNIATTSYPNDNFISQLLKILNQINSIKRTNV
jgi:tetratricopeptide (TPR) repeat protein